MDSCFQTSRFARVAGVVAGILILNGIAPALAQPTNETINFAGNVDQSLSFSKTVPDGAPVDGTLFFADSNTVAIASTASQTTYTNAQATVKYDINGTNSVVQELGATVALNVPDASGFFITCDRLFITWGSNLDYGIVIYSKLTNIVNSAQVGITNSQWWANRLPYPADYVVSIHDTLAPLTVFGAPPRLAINRTNGNEIVSYPTNVTGYTLEFSTALITNSSVIWQAVTNSAVVNGTNWNITLSNSPPDLFFRLATPN